MKIKFFLDHVEEFQNAIGNTRVNVTELCGRLGQSLPFENRAEHFLSKNARAIFYSLKDMPSLDKGVRGQWITAIEKMQEYVKTQDTKKEEPETNIEGFHLTTLPKKQVKISISNQVLIEGKESNQSQVLLMEFKGKNEPLSIEQLIKKHQIPIENVIRESKSTVTKPIQTSNTIAITFSVPSSLRKFVTDSYQADDMNIKADYRTKAKLKNYIGTDGNDKNVAEQKNAEAFKKLGKDWRTRKGNRQGTQGSLFEL